MHRNSHGQAWYLARHLQRMSADLAGAGFAEAALLVGAAAISVGDETVQRGAPAERVAVVAKPLTFGPTKIRHA